MKHHPGFKGILGKGGDGQLSSLVDPPGYSTAAPPARARAPARARGARAPPPEEATQALRKYTAEEAQNEYKTVPAAAELVQEHKLRSENAVYTTPRAARA